MFIDLFLPVMLAMPKHRVLDSNILKNILWMVVTVNRKLELVKKKCPDEY